MRLNRPCMRLALLTLSVGLTAGSSRGADWPMWRYDAARSAASPDALPSTLHLEWTLELTPAKSAWPGNQTKLQFDAHYEPVVMGRSLFVPSMISDSVTAYDTETGAMQWRFFADGPVRFAPIARDGKVWFVSDDGYLYCLQAENGSVLWRFRGGPGDKRVLGNDRLISAWPARGAPVLVDDTVYFAASLWPFMGIFIHAVDAETGHVEWTNSGNGTDYTVQQHNGPAFAGVVPQGYLAATGNRLLIPGGRSMPAVYDRGTGAFLHFDLASRTMGSKGGGGYAVMACDDFYINGGDAYGLADGKYFAEQPATVLTDDVLYGVDRRGRLVASKPKIEEVMGKDRRGRPRKGKGLKTLWTATTEPALGQLFLKAGPRLYGTTKDGALVAVDVGSTNAAGDNAKIVWQAPIARAPQSMIAAAGKLFVMTDREIHCYGAKDGGPRVVRDDALSHEPRAADGDASEANAILRQTGVREGYALVLGLGDGPLVEQLLAHSALHVIAVDPDAEKVAALRGRLTRAGLYGTRAAVHVGDPLSFTFPPYLASLIVSGDLRAAGANRGATFAQRVFAPLRPYGGVACFKLSERAHESLARVAVTAGLEKAEVERSEGYSLLIRKGALLGAGEWTHHYGDAANTVLSADRRVKAPLGLLWFGGPSNEKVLPRHGHGPPPQVAGGRLFIEGPDMMRAVDVYTGRVVWERTLPGLGAFYDNTSHEPGANAIGSNYVSLADGVYVVHENRCLRLDPATGATLSTFTLPGSDGNQAAAEWGHIAIWEDLLIGGARPLTFESREFTSREFRRLRVTGAAEIVASWTGFEPVQAGTGRGRGRGTESLRVNLNKLMGDRAMLSRIPADVREKADAGEAEQQLETFLSTRGAGQVNGARLEVLNRQLLEAYYRLPRYRPPQTGRYGSVNRTASGQLVAMNRMTGEVQWTFDAKHVLRHNAIAIGGGFVFALDRQPDQQASFLKRRGLPANLDARIIALDARDGRLLWSASQRIFGTWLGYSAEHDVLLQAGSKSGDRAQDEVGRGMVAYRGLTGEVLWENDLTYAGPCMLYHDRVLTQGYRTPGVALDLRTGETITRSHPLTGETVNWGYTRNYGCNTAIASEHLITFRSAAAGFYDLFADGGTGNMGGFRSGCSSNLIVADGVLNAPDYTRTCTCSYSNQSSIALVPVDDTEMWTFNYFTHDGAPVQRVGLNFGAPGDRKADNGTLWMDYPSVGGKSPDLAMTVTPDDVRYHRYHASSITGQGLTWVAASGLEGAETISITLAKEAPSVRPYTVRLHFAETGGADVGQRVFSVRLQDQPVLTDFDIAKAAGGPHRAVVRSFPGIAISNDLKIDLTSTAGASSISGVEIVAETP